MTRKELLKLQFRSLRLTVFDRLKDFANLAVPVFIVVGIIAASAKFWTWVFWR